MPERDEKGVPLITVLEVNQWRIWLEKNHLKEKKVGMVSYKKHTGKSSISHRAAMEEAINFGWIDTTIKRLDEERFVRYFVRRGENANWSKNTLRYGKQLLGSGRMSPLGVQRLKQGLKKRPHDYGIPANPSMPEELKQELVKISLLKEFDSFAPSVKRMLYRRILRAKTSSTKARRIQEVIKKLAENGTQNDAV